MQCATAVASNCSRHKYVPGFSLTSCLASQRREENVNARRSERHDTADVNETRLLPLMDSFGFVGNEVS